MKKAISLFLTMCFGVCFCLSASAQSSGNYICGAIETPNGIPADESGPQERGSYVPDEYSPLPLEARAKISSSVFTDNFFKTSTGEVYTTFNGTIVDALGNPSTADTSVTIALYKYPEGTLVQSHTYGSATQWSNRILKWNGLERTYNYYIKISKPFVLGTFLDFTLGVSQYP